MAPVPPGIDYEPLASWLGEHVPGAGSGPLTFELIGAGRSNVTHRFWNAAGTWVLRRPPLGHLVATAHDMGREFTVISAVGAAGFPVPRPIAICDDTAVNGAPFYVMEYVEGIILIDRLPDGFAMLPADRKAISTMLVESLARLHAVDYQAVGLGSFGRPEGYLERQVRRWSQQWEANRTRDLPEIDTLRERLEVALPPSPAPAIVHGDYRLGNMILDRDEPGRLAAMLDWEMSTLGDPLADLGYTLCYWAGEGHMGGRPPVLDDYASFTAAERFASRDELVAAYARASSRDVSRIAFYEVFALYKLAVITEGIHRRFVEGKQLGIETDEYEHSAVDLARYALEVASRSDDRRLRGH